MKFIAIALVLVFGFEYSNSFEFKNGRETIPGLGARKQQLLKCGADTELLAIAMLEEKTMNAKSYPYGDVYPGGKPKTGDAANFGVFKQNWYMIRLARPEWHNLGSNDWNTGAVLNTDVCKDVDTVKKSIQRLGWDQFYTQHREGASGHPTDKLVVDYRKSVVFIRDEISSDYNKYTKDDTRFWVDQVPI